MNGQQMETLSLILEFIQTGGVIAVLLLWLSDVRKMRDTLFQQMIENHDEARASEKD